jgi:hypothetical protein
MRVCEYFNLNLTQPSLDFVDVDVRNDVRLFVDPRAFLAVPSEWGNECAELIREFFRILIQAVHNNDRKTGLNLLRRLREPNETRLGFSVEGARGRAVGCERSMDLWNALRNSDAVHTGLVEDIDDTTLMVPGIGPDIISDITTNILREPLIEYTQAACQVFGIPLQNDIPSGPLWNPRKNTWSTNYVHLPVIEHRKLLLIPKVIVRYKMTYDPGEYYRNYLLEDLGEEELSCNSPLVQILSDGRRRVTKKSLMEKYGTGKDVLVQQTLRHPEALRRYHERKRMPDPPLSHLDLVRDPQMDLPDWDLLINNVLSLTPGRTDATNYEKAIEALLYALFYPALANPISQHPIHNGRKRVDITFTNVAIEGFFHWLALSYRSPHVFVECKNYGRELGNPELDQLSGRFSPARGQCGLLVCRSFQDKTLLLQRCKDTAQDQRGFIIPLEDSDLINLVEQKRQPSGDIAFPLLKDRFDRLIM